MVNFIWFRTEKKGRYGKLEKSLLRNERTRRIINDF